MSSSDEQTMNFDQRVMTEPKRQTYAQLVPPQEPDQQEENSELNHNSLEGYEPEKGQKKLTDFLIKKEQNPQKNPNCPNSQSSKAEHQQYKVIVKDDPSQRQKSSSQRDSFYKNNDIYGVQDQINQPNLSPNQVNNQNQDVEFREPEVLGYFDVEIDRLPAQLPSQTTSTAVEIVVIEVITQNDDSRKPQQNQFSANNQFQDSNVKVFPTSEKRQNFSSDDQNKKVTQTHSDDQLNNRSDHPLNEEKKSLTEAKQKDNNKGVTFFYNKQGNLIYTEECYKEPMSQQNMKAYVEPVEKPEKMEVDEDYVRPQDKEDHLEGVPEALKKDQSGPKTIIYRREDDLGQILDFMGMKEQAEVKVEEGCQEKPQSKQSDKKVKIQKPQDVQIDGEPQMKQSKKKPIRHPTISQMLPNSIADEQIQMQSIPSLVDRPHPTINTSQKRMLAVPIHERQTKKKEFTKGSTDTKLKTPLKQQDNSISNRSNRQIVPSGSVYHFEIIPNRISHKKNIVQVRRSSRIYSKSKSKLEYELAEKLQEVEESQQNQNYSNTNAMTQRRERSDEKKNQQKLAKSSKPKTSLKSKSKTNAKSKSKPKQKEQNESEEITIEWLKEHIGELNQIVVHNAYMEQDYYAMTEKDQAICRFLHAFQNAQVAFEHDEVETKVEYEQVRENRFIGKKEQKEDQKVENREKVEKRGKEQKKGRKPTKSKAKVNSIRQVSKQKPNIKIEKTVELTVKSKKNQNISSNQQHFNNDYHEPADIDIDGPNPPSIQQSLNNQQQSHPHAQSISQPNNKLIFKQNLQKYRVPQQLPITVKQVVNPDILNLGVYALIKLGRVSEFQFGTRYAITPLCMIRYARKKHVLMALEESKKLVPVEFADKIALIALNTMLIQLIEKAREEMGRGGQQQEQEREGNSKDGREGDREIK